MAIAQPYLSIPQHNKRILDRHNKRIMVQLNKRMNARPNKRAGIQELWQVHLKSWLNLFKFYTNFRSVVVLPYDPQI
jgi:hypothetical protein